MSRTTQPSDALLRFGLRANAVFSTACAVGLLLNAPTLSLHLAIDAWGLRSLALALLGFAVFLVVQAGRQTLRLFEAAMTSLGDFVWVVGSLVFVGLWSGLTGFGTALVAGVAAGVGLLGMVQILGLRKLTREPDETRGTRQRLELRHVVQAPPAAMWEVISDLGGIERYSDDLTETFLRAGAAPGVGAVRECANVRGQRWAERCVAFQPPTSLELEYHADEPGFPFPMRRLQGGWGLEPLGLEATAIRVWWSFTANLPGTGTLIAAVMSESLRRSFPQMLERMGEDAAQRAGRTCSLQEEHRV